MNCAGFADDHQVVALPRMPASFQNRRLKAFSLGHEHTLALDRAGRHVPYRAAKYYNDLPEEIKFKLDESARYNRLNPFKKLLT